MKTILFISIAVVQLCCNDLYSQQDSADKKVEFVLKTEVLLPVIALFVNSFQPRTNPDNVYIGALTFESCFKQRHTVQLTGLFISSRNQFDYQIIVAYKYFLSKYNPYSGFYSGIYFKYLRTQITDHAYFNEPITEYDWGIGEGVLLGYQNTISSRFLFDILIGFGDAQILYKPNNSPYGLGKNHSYIDGIYGISLGYKF